ncbi:MAG TPA: Gfo/Idh/MocA family oxidoreductase [Candidatus Marinimicrobia bacterium]|nr:Gfo/Idh/MocA family oxidoreductase [Candidatus Neomarinimicrobiota bacterium]HRS51066.1 Gfo/Idh/MocA family oxidoreductase [Candidatus Neomarinimicrobiota bacterium]HRU92573.1 Gfo/Idh/MocA family oxidoreductase [Candidatus Neomarinimicrobiota bacterium]
MKTIKFAIVGCGRIAQRHAEQIHRLGELSAVCDIKESAALTLSEKYNCHPYFDLDPLLKNEPDVDVVSVCTPNYLHAEHSIKSLKAGKNVLCEKPMALSVRDCENMIYTAEQTNRRLFIVKQNRYNPPVVELKKIIEENRLGKICYVQLNCFWNRNEDYYLQSDWKGRLAKDGGTLYTQFSHFIDLLIWLFGDFKNVKVLLRNYLHPNIEFEDTGAVLIEFFDGAIGTINYTVNSYRKNMEGSITVFGEKGTVKIGGQYLNALEYQNIENYSFQNVMPVNKANDYGFYQGSMSNHDKVYENVVNVLNGKDTIATNAIEGLKVVRIIEDIYSQSKLK